MQLVEYYSLFPGSSLYNFASMYLNDLLYNSVFGLLKCSFAAPRVALYRQVIISFMTF